MPDVPDLFNEANELVELGRLDEALTLFQALLRPIPTTPHTGITSGSSDLGKANTARH